MNLESYFNKLKSDFPDINLPGIFEAERMLRIPSVWKASVILNRGILSAIAVTVCREIRTLLRIS